MTWLIVAAFSGWIAAVVFFALWCVERDRSALWRRKYSEKLDRCAYLAERVRRFDAIEVAADLRGRSTASPDRPHRPTGNTTVVSSQPAGDAGGGCRA